MARLVRRSRVAKSAAVISSAIGTVRARECGSRPRRWFQTNGPCPAVRASQYQIKGPGLSSRKVRRMCSGRGGSTSQKPPVIRGCMTISPR